ncbi:hypothetical protein GOB93_03410 [Acetobacter musti]|uniref:Transposase n=1 Tax=Acetobacter musti TaxID=864732 RepID=A0ABX0JNL8_9PROT|nr:hypothetical protein [Acetobacter musti]
MPAHTTGMNVQIQSGANLDRRPHEHVIQSRMRRVVASSFHNENGT